MIFSIEYIVFIFFLFIIIFRCNVNDTITNDIIQYPQYKKSRFKNRKKERLENNEKDIKKLDDDSINDLNILSMINKSKNK